MAIMEKKEKKKRRPFCPIGIVSINISPTIQAVIFGEIARIGLAMGYSQYCLKNLEKTNLIKSQRMSLSDVLLSFCF